MPVCLAVGYLVYIYLYLIIVDGFTLCLLICMPILWLMSCMVVCGCVRALLCCWFYVIYIYVFLCIASFCIVCMYACLSKDVFVYHVIICLFIALYINIYFSWYLYRYVVTGSRPS